MTRSAPQSRTPDDIASDGPVDGFAVHLENFEGPFDLLLQLISRHQMDIGDVALSQVTDEFIAHLRSLGSEWELDATTSFLVIASTLLDLKVVRLLPSAELEDEGDLALLEARDLLFARLMQYRAFKQAAALIATRLEEESLRVPRSVTLDDRLAALLPDVLITLGPAEFAVLAARVLTPREQPALALDHLHAPHVSVREQAATLVGRLRRVGSATFRSLTADSPDTLTTVARFLALLELFREGTVAFEQVTPLGELSVRWTGSDDGDIEVADEYDASRPPAETEAPAESVTEADIARIADGSTSEEMSSQ
ncbi:MAG: segregation/condensation protein A [Nocardioidaceae bacterium]